MNLRLLAPKLFSEFVADEWKAYVESLYVRTKQAKAWSFRRNAKGTPILTVRERKPKFLLPEEFAEVLIESKMTEPELIEFLKEKKIERKE